MESGHRNASSFRGGVLLISLYSSTCITLGVTIARFVIGLMHKVEFDNDDGMILCSSIVYTGATVAWQYAVNGGLGTRFSDADALHRMTYFRSVYAAHILDLVAMGFAKLSSAFLLGRVAPQTRRQNMILFGMVGSWSLFSAIAFAFECGLPQPWRFDPPQCAHGGVLYTIIILNIVSDIVLAAWIYPILMPLNMDREKRLAVALLFGSRAIVPLVAVAQFWAAVKAVQGDDPTWDGFALSLLTQAVTSLSLIVANLPRIKRFLGTAGSGMGYPTIHETELTRSNRRPSRVPDTTPLKLVPSSSNEFKTTVTSGKSKKGRTGSQHEWHNIVPIGSKQEEHTSTSSLLDREGGVMMQQEVMVDVEARPGRN